MRRFYLMNNFQQDLQMLNLGDYQATQAVPYDPNQYYYDDERLYVGIGGLFRCYSCFSCYNCFNCYNCFSCFSCFNCGGGRCGGGRCGGGRCGGGGGGGRCGGR